MFDFNQLNPEQQQVVRSKHPRILCLAGAGTGKTMTLTARLLHIVQSGVDPSSILVLTFTRAAAFEMEERYKRFSDNIKYPEFRTFHGFCYSLICKDPNVRNSLGYVHIPDIADDAKIKELKLKASMQVGCKLSQAKIEGRSTLTEKETVEFNIFWKAYKRLLKQSNIITYDMLCNGVCDLFVNQSDSVKQYVDKYKYILIDEFQDTDPLQWKFVQSFVNANLFVCGDALQCQPAGTKVMLADWTEINIEDLKVGDKVLTYNSKDSRYIQNLKFKSGNIDRYAKKITAVSSHFAKDVVRVSSENHSSCYTLDHITYAKIHYEGNEDSHVTYIMSNDKGWWRVGSTKLFLQSQNSEFGPRLRLQSEHGDRIWVLGVHSNVTDAWMQEQLVAYKYGIPQVTWEHSNVKFSKDDLSQLYGVLGDLEPAAKKCLDDFDRNINYPMFTRGDSRVHFSKMHMFECRVGNLIPGVFDLVYPSYIDGKYRNQYEVITSIEPQPPQQVYGLNVEDYHNYVGDGILTHNCIYAFRGSDSSIIKQIAKDEDWETHKLFRNYRSVKKICDFANSEFKDVSSEYKIDMDSIKLGGCVTVSEIERQYGDNDVIANRAVDIIQEFVESEGSSAILCRTNSEVEAVASKLVDMNIRCKTSLHDIDTIHLIKSISDDVYAMNWLASELPLSTYPMYVRNKHNNPEYNFEGFIQDFSETYAISDKLSLLIELRTVWNRDEEIQDKVNSITDILRIPDIDISNLPESSDDVLFGILSEISNSQADTSLYVGTIHSSKGLEYDNVLLVGVGGKQFRLTNQENRNLYYVGITRARTNLHVVIEE